jgi:hypothetical protein
VISHDVASVIVPDFGLISRITEKRGKSRHFWLGKLLKAYVILLELDVKCSVIVV